VETSNKQKKKSMRKTGMMGKHWIALMMISILEAKVKVKAKGKPITSDMRHT
jgi:hypothetical protein